MNAVWNVKDMKQKWSASWNSSVQPRKQRKYRHNAPLHVRHKFLGVRLSSEYTRQFGRRTLPVRKGDEVRLMRGSSSGLKGIVEKIDMKKNKVYVEGIIAKKVDGSEVMKAMEPSNLMITKPSMDDKKRQAILVRTEEKAKVLRSQKPKEKPAPEKKAEDKKEEPKPEAKAEEKKGYTGPIQKVQDSRDAKDLQKEIQKRAMDSGARKDSIKPKEEIKKK